MKIRIDKELDIETEKNNCYLLKNKKRVAKLNFSCEDKENLVKIERIKDQSISVDTNEINELLNAVVKNKELLYNNNED